LKRQIRWQTERQFDEFACACADEQTAEIILFGGFCLSKEGGVQNQYP
jgi:hypothetical protein